MGKIGVRSSLFCMELACFLDPKSHPNAPKILLLWNSPKPCGTLWLHLRSIHSNILNYGQSFLWVPARAESTTSKWNLSRPMNFVYRPLATCKFCTFQGFNGGANGQIPPTRFKILEKKFTEYILLAVVHLHRTFISTNCRSDEDQHPRQTFKSPYGFTWERSGRFPF